MTTKSPPKTYTVTIKKLVYEGYGLTHLDGKTVFVPKTLPGDIVSIRIVQKKRRILFARVVERLTDSPLRKEAPCPHTQDCGGCQLMDVDYEDQLELKEAILEDTIQSFYPELANVVSPIVGCETQQYHRNKMDFSFSESDGTLELGLKKQFSFSEHVPVTDCLLLSKQSNEILDFARQFFKQHPLSIWDNRAQTGSLQNLMIRHSKAFDQYMVNIVSATVEPCFKHFAEELSTTFPNVISINHIHYIQKAGQTSTMTSSILKGEETLKEKINDLTFHISPLSFFQTNSLQVGKLYDTVKECCPLKPGQTLMDLYCGTGTIGLYLIQDNCQLLGIEENESAIKNAKKNAIENGITNAEFRVGRVKNILKFEKPEADCIIIDPPRSGMVPKALRRVCETECMHITYVSCNPVTLLRDLKEFVKAGYSVKTFIPVDMFPHTYHLETVVQLERSEATVPE